MGSAANHSLATEKNAHLILKQRKKSIFVLVYIIFVIFAPFTLLSDSPFQWGMKAIMVIIVLSSNLPD